MSVLLLPQKKFWKEINLMDSKGIIVAIDGPAGAGKSSVAKAVARQTGMTFVDTGAIYRSLAYWAKAQKIALSDQDALAGLTERLPIRFEMSDAGQKVYLELEDVTNAIRSPEVSLWASEVSQFPKVRDGLLSLQRRMGESPVGAVLEGRDIGTVVFPNAQVKIFLTADPKERARRRVEQMAEKGTVVSLDDVMQEMKERDKRDQERSAAPLVQASDATAIDSTKFSMEDVIAQIVTLVVQARGKENE